jgi:hypothetical protein
MKTGGRVLTTEFFIHTVIIVPRSPKTACPTYFVLIWTKMLWDCTTVETPVSSMLYTLSAVNFQNLSARL